MDRSQPKISTRDSLTKIRLDTRETRSLETLRRHFEHLQELRRQSLDDFDLQVLIGDIHQEIIDRARYLRGESPVTVASRADQPVSFATSVSVETAKPAPPPQSAPLPEVIQEPSDAAEIPPEVTRVDAKSWQMILGLAGFLCIIVLVGFFYLIQTARKLNIEDDTQAKAQKTAAIKTETNAGAPVPATPTLRLYTDLAAGTITLDDQAPRDLVDGELTLDNLLPGRHSIKIAGLSGSASFQFEVVERNAPKVIGVPQASNALAVLVSQQDGVGQLITSAGRADILLDGNTAGEAAPATGLALVGLGTTDHDLQVVHDGDRQRFVMTYTPAPVLTAFVKSDSNTGILQVSTGEDGVEVYIENELFRRKTEHGQVRFSVRAGTYNIRVHKDGFNNPPAVSVEVKKAEVTPVQFHLVPMSNVATLQIKGAQPGTTAYIDREFASVMGADGGAKVSNVKPGDHVIELRHDQAITKKLERTLRAGEILTLSGPDVVLEKSAPEPKPTVATTPVTTAPAASEDSHTPANTAPTESSMEGTHVQKGGGFVPYDTPKSAGHYSFSTRGHVGGMLKKGKLQWYAGYLDSQNYILFSVDGKHAEVREVWNGKSAVLNRVPFNVDSSSWLQVDLAVKPGSVSAHVRTAGEGWTEIGSVASEGRDFTQNKVGFYIPPNDEVAVANFKFANR